MFGRVHGWMLPFLPFGSELLYSDSYPHQAWLQHVDLDGDGKREVIGIFRSNQQPFLFVLKKHFGHIRLISTLPGSGYRVSYLGTAQIKEKNEVSIVVGWQNGSNWSKLSLYKWNEAGLMEEKLNGEFMFSKIEIEDIPGPGGLDGKDEIALWLHDTNEAYRVKIYRWEDGKLKRANDVEPHYFKKVTAYYQQKIKENPSDLFYNSYLHDSEKKTVLETRAVYLFPAIVKEIGGNKWGYIDAKGEFILPPIYELAGDFTENDLAIVRLMDRDGVINSNGYFIVRPKYDAIHPFSEGRAVVIDHYGFKVIDESGKEITSKAYTFISDYKEGRAIIADSNEHGQYLYGYLNRMGKEVLPLQYEFASDFHESCAVVKMKDGSNALISLTGKIIAKYPYYNVGDYGEGLLPFQGTKDEKYGYINVQGNIVISPQFSGAQRFEDGRAIVQLTVDDKEQYGLINMQGHYILKPNFTSLLNLSEGLYGIGKPIDPEKPYVGTRYAIADSVGHILTGFIYDGITNYKDGIASAYNDQSTFFIDKNGKRVENLPQVSGSGILSFDKSLIKGEIDFRSIYFNQNGKVIWEQNTVIPLGHQKAVVEHKYKPNKDYLVYYPQIRGLSSVNETLKKLAGIKEIPNQTPLNSMFMGEFEVTFFKKDLVVIEINSYEYTFGAAHGMPHQKYAHIDLQTGELYQLKNLFRSGSDYEKVISDIIHDQIASNETYTYVFPNSFKGIQPSHPFFINEEGLNIYFAPYDIAPYAAGFPTFTVPFEELMKLIDYDGDFWKSFH